MSPSAVVESGPPRHTAATENLVDGGIVLTLAMFWVGFYQRIPEIGQDSSCYMGVAQSLTTMGAYEFNYQNHTIYPPGFPVFVSLEGAFKKLDPEFDIMTAIQPTLHEVVIDQMSPRALGARGLKLLTQYLELFTDLPKELRRGIYSAKSGNLKI